MRWLRRTASRSTGSRRRGSVRVGRAVGHQVAARVSTMQSTWSLSRAISCAGVRPAKLSFARFIHRDKLRLATREGGHESVQVREDRFHVVRGELRAGETPFQPVLEPDELVLGDPRDRLRRDTERVGCLRPRHRPLSSWRRCSTWASGSPARVAFSRRDRRPHSSASASVASSGR